MDSKKFAKLAVSHFKEVGYYSEIDADKLENILEKYIESVYRYKLKIMSIKMNVDEENGEPWISERRDKETETLMEEMGIFIQILFANKKSDKKLEPLN